MKKNLVLASFAVVCLDIAAGAQTAVPAVQGGRAPLVVDGGSLRVLTELAEGRKNGDDTFDGMPVLRREGPLAILTEDKTLIGQHDVPAKLRSQYRVIGVDGHADPAFGEEYVLESGYSVKEYRVRQKVGIADREGYLRRQARVGRRLGVLGGSVLGATLALALGAGILLLAGLASGIIIGDVTGRRAAKRKPRVFQREFEVNE